MSKHRKCPKPLRADKGTCRWCRQPCPPRRTWHLGGKGERDCLREYKLTSDPGFTRQAVFERDKGICVRCGLDAPKEAREVMKRTGRYISGDGWQHDHIRPLIEANGDISFWELVNIQTLCTRCHVVKGREDNARRRAARQPTLAL